ncbi:MAG: hypothetical protein H3Z50_07505 [archaeon]|nr:hypothetical protein [archaeon]MCP8306487.1 hypothetical protein [archaeon]
MKPTAQEILSALADEKAIKIFRLAESGLKGGKDAPQKLSISPKQYYSRLKKLVNLGLIEKKNGVYTHTTLGMIVQNTQIKPLEEAVANFWHLQAVNELKRSKIIPEKEQEEIIKSIIKGTSLREFCLDRPPHLVKVFRTFEELASYGRLIIGVAQDEIFIASRYYDPIVSQKLIEKFAEGVKLNILDGNPPGSTLSNRLKSVLKADTNPKTIALVKSYIESPKVRIRETELDYSFFVIDGVRCGFEVPNIVNPHEFALGIEFEDRDFAHRMIELFEKLWEKAEDPMLRKLVAKNYF